MSRIPKLSTYAEGTPERTLLRFLRAWEKRDWQDMAWACQVSWRRDQRRTIGSITARLRDWYQRQRIESVNILHRVDTLSKNPEKPGVALTDVFLEMKIAYQMSNGRWATTDVQLFQIRLICEDTNGDPDPLGDWGVSPLSKRPIEKQEGGTPPLSPHTES